MRRTTTDRCSTLFVVAVLMATPPCLSTGASAQTAGSDVAREIQRRGSARVVVALKPPAPRSSAERRRAIGLAQARVMAAVGAGRFEVLHRFDAVPAMAGNVTAAGLQSLLANPDVARVDLDVGGSGDLSSSVPQIHADVVQDVYGVDGSGVTVAVLDSGIDSDHPDLAGALVGEQCFCSGGGGCCPGGGATQSGPGAAEDDQSHGTHVIGIITGDGNVAPRGVAPGADVVAVKVLDSNNVFCCASDIVAALDWVLNNRPDVRAVNMSLGTFATFSGECDNATAFTMAFAGVIDALTANGVAVFASAGNDALTGAMGAPACVANTISVGAVNDFDAVASFSNSDATLDLLAPGVTVVSAGLGGGTASKSGTSMASPHAAGTAALLFEAFPGLSQPVLLATLKATGLPVTDPRNGLVDPRIDAEAALLALQGSVGDFKCYKVKDLKSPKFASTLVALADQFGVNDGGFDVKKPLLVCNPADTNGAGIANPADHLTCYKIKGPKLDRSLRPRVQAADALGVVQLEVKKPFLLCVPSAKSLLP